MGDVILYCCKVHTQCDILGFDQLQFFYEQQKFGLDPSDHFLLIKEESTDSEQG